MPKIVLLVRIWTQRGSLSSSTRQVVNGNIEHLNCSTNIKTCNSRDTPINRLTSFFAKTFTISRFSTQLIISDPRACQQSKPPCEVARIADFRGQPSRKVRTGCFGFSLKNRFLFDKFSDFKSFDRTWQCQLFMFTVSRKNQGERASASRLVKQRDEFTRPYQFDGI